MEAFWVYFQLGFEHISDVNGYDHILFIIALCAVYQIKEWKSLVILITAFTVGHSITLALATLQLISVSSEWVEFLIPVTIFLTCIFNFHYKEKRQRKRRGLRYWVAVFFGLVHGLGFSNYLRALLGKEESIFSPLLSFNLGLEIGQLMIVGLLLILSFLFISLKVKQREWLLLLSGAAGGISFIMMLERIPMS